MVAGKTLYKMTTTDYAESIASTFYVADSVHSVIHNFKNPLSKQRNKGKLFFNPSRTCITDKLAVHTIKLILTTGKNLIVIFHPFSFWWQVQITTAILHLPISCATNRISGVLGHEVQCRGNCAIHTVSTVVVECFLVYFIFFLLLSFILIKNI